LLAQKGNQPRYSPDGQWLSFTLPDTGYGQQGLTTAVYLMPAEGGERIPFATGFFASSNPIWSPDASRLLYAGSDLHSASEAIRFQLDGAASGGTAWYITPISGGQRVRIEPSAQFAPLLPAFPIPVAWLRNNRILFSYGSGDAVNLWLATLSPDNRRIVGPPEQLTFGTGRITDASVAGSGAMVFGITVPRPRLWDVPLETKEIPGKGDTMAVVTNRDFTYWPSLSDTGKLAYLAETSDKFNLWLRDLPSGKETLLASVEAGGNINRVSAYINRTGTQMAYTTLHGSKQVIYTIGAGGGTPEKICEDCGQLRSWSPDRKVMLSQERIFSGSKLVAVRINRIDVASGRKAVLLEKRGFLFSPDLSPDGRWVAFQARAALADRREQLFLAAMSDGAPVEPERWVPITELKYFDADPVFSRDGKILYFTSDRDGSTCLWAVRLDPASKKPVGDPYPVRHFHGNPRHYSWYPVFSVGPDRIVICLEHVQSDLWMTQLQEGK
jgi:Tol biopolymer transport system component